jgi:Cdc6-like AAA superfamily ATPase
VRLFWTANSFKFLKKKNSEKKKIQLFFFFQDSVCTNFSNDTVTVASRLRDAPAKVFSTYDAVFSENCDNKLVYDTVVAPLVQSTLQGFNTTVFCYGQTGTGKTHTMEGVIFFFFFFFSKIQIFQSFFRWIGRRRCLVCRSS